ncbi:MAG: DUF4249 domain-containing protein [Bacteroidales bacterium]
MRRRLKYGKMIGGTLLVLGLGACTEIIDIELDSTYQRLVVYGTVTDDSLQHGVQLSLSSDYFSNAPPPPVPGATVQLESGNRTFTLVEQDTLPGLYLSGEAFRGEMGETYELRVSGLDVDGDGMQEEYHAESTIVSGARVDSIKVTYFLSPFFSGYQISLYALDPPERNWYNFKIWKNGELLTRELSDYFIQTDDFFNGTYIYGLPVGFLDDDNPDEKALPGDTITLELNSIDQGYYQFISEAQLEIAGNNPLFSGPSANITSNLDGGAKGVFAAYAVQRVSKIIPVEPE